MISVDAPSDRQANTVNSFTKMFRTWGPLGRETGAFFPLLPSIWAHEIFYKKNMSKDVCYIPMHTRMSTAMYINKSLKGHIFTH